MGLMHTPRVIASNAVRILYAAVAMTERESWKEVVNGPQHPHLYQARAGL
jgi:hypothetical protein